MKRLWLPMLFAVSSLSAATICLDSLGNAPRDLSGLPMGWRDYRKVIGGKSGTRQITSVQGKPAVVMKDDGPGEIGFFKEFPVTGGQYLRGTIHAALPKGGTANDAFVMQFSFIGKTWHHSSIPLSVSSEKFDKFSLYAQAPAGTRAVRCYIYSHKDPTGSIAVRDLQIESSDKPFGGTPAGTPIAGGGIRLMAAGAKLNTANVQATSAGVIMKEGGKSVVGVSGAEPDLVFDVKLPRPGLYEIRTESSVDKTGAALMLKSRTKYDSMAAQFQIDDARPTQRYIFVPWSRPQYCLQVPGKFQFSGKAQKLKIWLPEHCALKTVTIVPYRPWSVPAAAQNYKPRYTPPKGHPRLWTNPQDVAKIRARLTHPEHAPYWARLKEQALRPAQYTFDPQKEMKHDVGLEVAMVNKAFYYLMTGDQAVGKEAVRLAQQYLELVEFGNLLDITREMGRAIYSAACVYDWCYDLLEEADRQSLLKNFMRLARDMECAWPPFKQSIVNGHGNELQINRDLLSMAIAIYDEDPVPYKYCSYLILEQLVPMRKYEYRSPRHNQGVGYGSFRFPCDLRSATLFRQMLGFPVFDENIKNVPLFWMYMRTPFGGILPDGDGSMAALRRYWAAPDLYFLSMTYSGNPLFKGEFKRQVPGMYHDTVLFLLLNEPELETQSSLASLPLTIDFGPTLSGMIARTGWRLGGYSDDVQVEFKGGGTHAGGHQHADAGAFQIFYRGYLATRLGQYHYYGTPYDMNFCKRSVAQSMMLVRDPKEPVRYGEVNDGGSTFILGYPHTPEQAVQSFRYGEKLYCSFGPSAMRPYYSSFAADLTSAYGKKVKKFVRSFHFFNMDREDVPAVIVMTDDLTSADPSFRKYWQIATLEKPQLTKDGAVLTAGSGRNSGKLHLSMPVPAEKKVELKGGKDLHDVFGRKYNPPAPKAPQANGYRVMFSPAKESAQDRFLTIMQVTDKDAKPLAIRRSETAVSYVLEFGDRAVSLNSGTAMIRERFAFDVTGQGTIQILAAGLAAGPWTVTGPAGTFRTEVAAGKNTIFLTGKAGTYTFAPGKAADAKPLPDHSDLAPAERIPIPENSVTLYGKALPGVRCVRSGGVLLAAAEPLLRALGGRNIVSGNGFLQCDMNADKVVYYLDSGDVTVNGVKTSFPGVSRVINGKWNIPVTSLVLFGLDAQEDHISRSVELVSRPDWLKNILWVTSRSNSNRDQLYTMLSDDSASKGTYWDGEGKGAGFEIGLVRPQVVDGVGIRFMMGFARKAFFAIEVSDGGPWKRVFDGASSGNAEGLEIFRFPAEKISRIRFVGFGNAQNLWNSLITFKILEKK